MHSQVLLSTMHVQLCTLNRYREHQRTHFLHACYRMCICNRYREIYIYICAYAYMNIYIYMYMYIYMRMCMYMYLCIYVCVCVCICMYIYVYACIRVYVYMYICIYVCIYTSPYAFLRRVCMHSQVLLSTMHVQVCTLDRCCEHHRTHLLHARYRTCICAKYMHVYMHI